MCEEVRAFYERFPYPPPIETWRSTGGTGQDRNGDAPSFILYWPGALIERSSILIAGCGTSQAATRVALAAAQVPDRLVAQPA